jgi:hypothetical protein
MFPSSIINNLIQQKCALKIEWASWATFSAKRPKPERERVVDHVELWRMCSIYLAKKEYFFLKNVFK